jgi:predicted ferric reductase
MVGALAVFVVLLAVIATLMIRSASAPVTLAWFVSRGAGISGYLLITGGMVYGLLITTKTATSALPAPVSFGMHEFISWLGLIFIATHAVVLLWDAYIGYTPLSILLPFNSSYRPVWVGLGQAAFYMSALLVGSFYAKKRLGAKGHKAWRLIHYASFLVFVLATLHGIFSGSDTKVIAMQIVYIASTGLVLFLTVFRVLAPRAANRAANRRNIPVQQSQQAS